MTRHLYIIRGLPGSGKSTVAKRLSPDAYWEADQFHINEQGVYEWKPENVARAHQWCQRMVEGDMMSGHPVIAVANTFTREKEMEPYYTLARRYDYTVTELTVESTLDDAGLAARNIHHVPEATIAKMRQRWEK